MTPGLVSPQRMSLGSLGLARGVCFEDRGHRAVSEIGLRRQRLAKRDKENMGFIIGFGISVLFRYCSDNH